MHCRFTKRRKRFVVSTRRATWSSLSQPNAIRFERFIFDLLPLAKNALVVEADAAEAFAPVKNSDDEATDNPRTAKIAMMAQARRRLRAAGMQIADDVAVEINPLWADTTDRIHETTKARNDHLRTDIFFLTSDSSNPMLHAVIMAGGNWHAILAAEPDGAAQATSRSCRRPDDDPGDGRSAGRSCAGGADVDHHEPQPCAADCRATAAA